MAAADLDDVAQEVFLRLLRFDRAELVDQPKAYLFKMAINVASEWRMRAHQRWPHDSEWLADIPSDESADSQLQLKSRNDAIARAMEQLPPRVRSMLLSAMRSVRGVCETKSIGALRPSISWVDEEYRLR